MKKRSLIPETRVKNPEPKKHNEDWIIWAGWADRITFEDIEKKTGKIRKKKEKYIKNYCYSDTQNSKDYSKTIPPNIVLIFKITCLQKSLDTMFLA